MSERHADKVNLVYILGTSFSGSTLLGLILGSSDRIFNLSAVKLIERQRRRGRCDCSCGKPLQNCPFWSNHRFETVMASPDFSLASKLKIVFDVLIGRKHEFEKDTMSDNFLADSFKFARAVDPDTLYLLDVSRSLWRLIYLKKCRNVNLKIIYLHRDIYGNVSSFMKHKYGFWRGLFIYTLNNFIIRRFLKRNATGHLYISYADLCVRPYQILGTIGAYLSVDLTDYVSKVRQREFHILNGNSGTIEKVLKGFSGVDYDDSWQRQLNEFQKFVLGVITALNQRSDPSTSRR